MKNHESILCLANRAYRAGRHAEARALYEQALIAAPELERYISFNLRMLKEGRDTVAKLKKIETANRARERGRADSPVLGGLNISGSSAEIKGWLAVTGTTERRTAVVIFDGAPEIKLRADLYRSDLKARRINDGRHAFACIVPSKYIDGAEHEVALQDEGSGEIVERRRCSWTPIRRPYCNFEEYLKYSMTQPMVMAPFYEEDKRCFAVMESLALRLCEAAKELRRQPLVSVIMPVYNRADVVSQAIRSIINQRYSNWELIIIDDGSEDDSVNVIRKFKHNRIKINCLDANAGHCVARNAGLRLARGDIVAYLDSDNTWDERYLEAMVGAYTLWPAAESIYSGQYLHRGNSRQPFAVRYGHFNRALLENRNYIDLNCFSHRRRLLGKINGFDEELRRFVDYDYILRASEAGSMLSIPVCLSHYYYDKVENAVTNNVAVATDLEIVRKKLKGRQAKQREIDNRRSLTTPVTVVIPSWQALEDIKECIASILSSCPSPLDIVVVDNDSDEDVLKYLREQVECSNIRLIENKNNYGFTYAVNQGIGAARKDSDILLLNNDAILAPGAIPYLQEACYRLENAGMTVPRQVLPPKTKTLNVHVPFALDHIECDVNISAHHKNIASLQMVHDGTEVELNYAPFFAVYIRRSVIDEIGVLNAENGRHYRSDRVYCDFLRLASRRKIYYVPQAVAIHKLQKSTDTLRNSELFKKDFQVIFQKNQWNESLREELGFRVPAWDI